MSTDMISLCVSVINSVSPCRLTFVYIVCLTSKLEVDVEETNILTQLSKKSQAACNIIPGKCTQYNVRKLLQLNLHPCVLLVTVSL